MTVNETYESEYSNTDSAAFKNFSAEFEQKVGDFLNETLFGFDRVEVTRLANGSVVVDFDIVVQKSSNATVDVIVQALNDGNGKKGLGYTFLGSVSVNATDQQSTSSSPSPTATGIDNIYDCFSSFLDCVKTKSVTPIRCRILCHDILVRFDIECQRLKSCLG